MLNGITSSFHQGDTNEHTHVFNINKLSLNYHQTLEVFFMKTLMIKSFRTDRSRLTVQTQIRLLLQEQSDLGIHYPLFAIPFASFDGGLASFLEFNVDYSKVFWRPKIYELYGIHILQ